MVDLGLGYTYLTAEQMTRQDVRLVASCSPYAAAVCRWLSPVESYLSLGATGTGYFSREDASFGPPPSWAKIQVDHEDSLRGRSGHADWEVT